MLCGLFWNSPRFWKNNIITEKIKMENAWKYLAASVLSGAVLLSTGCEEKPVQKDNRVIVNVNYQPVARIDPQEAVDILLDLERLENFAKEHGEYFKPESSYEEMGRMARALIRTVAASPNNVDGLDQVARKFSDCNELPGSGHIVWAAMKAVDYEAAGDPYFKHVAETGSGIDMRAVAVSRIQDSDYLSRIVDAHAFSKDPVWTNGKVNQPAYDNNVMARQALMTGRVDDGLVAEVARESPCQSLQLAAVSKCNDLETLQAYASMTGEQIVSKFGHTPESMRKASRAELHIGDAEATQEEIMAMYGANMLGTICGEARKRLGELKKAKEVSSAPYTKSMESF
jgi:hypothetical protein